jgi:hypothetical protein
VVALQLLAHVLILEWKKKNSYLLSYCEVGLSSLGLFYLLIAENGEIYLLSVKINVIKDHRTQINYQTLAA